MEQVDLRGEPGQVGRLLERGVAAADDRDLAVAEEEAVARRAGRDAAAAQPGLALEAEPHRRRAGRDDDRPGPGIPCRGPRCRNGRSERSTRSMSTSTRRDAEPLGLGAHRGHQLRALDAVREARVVLDVARQHQLAARRRACEDDRLEVGPRRVDRGGQAGRAGSDDQELGVDAALSARERSTARRSPSSARRARWRLAPRPRSRRCHRRNRWRARRTVRCPS